MRAALLEAPHRLALVDVERPAISTPDEVLIRVRAVGICGSEIHAFHGTHPFRKAPVILGHEVGGEVIGVGSNVSAFDPGARVFVDPQWPCGNCHWCLTGAHNLCPAKQVLGADAWSGALGEYIVAPMESVYPIPDHVSYVEAAMIEPLSVAVHAANRAGMQSGLSGGCAVLGTGPIGMMVAGVAAARGAAPIVAVDIQPHVLEIAQRSFGATHTVRADRTSVTDEILAITGDDGIDAVFLTVGVPTLVQEALRCVRRQGTIVLLALFDEPIVVQPFDIIASDLTVVGSSMYNSGDIHTAIESVAAGTVPVADMVTHRLPLDQVQYGFEIAATKSEGAVKVVLEFDD